MRKVKKIWFSLMLLALVGCRARLVEERGVEIRDNVVERVLRDSIFMCDSIFVRERADTVFLTRYRTLYREKVRRDTIAVCDTIYVEKNVLQNSTGSGGGGGLKWLFLLILLLVLWRIGVFDFLSGFFKGK